MAAQNIVFQPGVNEELAATAVWGTQMLDLFPDKPQVRRRVRHLVRQGPGRGPLQRRLQARQHGRHQPARRRDRGGRRRPRGQEQHRRAPERPHLQGLRAAGVLPEQRAGHPGHGPARLRDEPLCRRVDEHEDHPGGGGVVVVGAGRPRPRQHHPARGLSRCRPAACTCAGPTARWTRKRACSTTSGMRRWPMCAPTSSTTTSSAAARPLRHHRQRQGLQRHAPGAVRPGPGRGRLPPAGHPAAQGQRGVAAGGHHHAPLRRRAAGDPGRRGKAPGHRVPGQGRALQLARRRAPQRAGQVRRGRRRQQRRRVEPPQPQPTGCCAPRPTSRRPSWRVPSPSA
jgi:hypothetical protein